MEEFKIKLDLSAAREALAFLSWNQAEPVSVGLQDDEIQVWLDDGTLSIPFDPIEGSGDRTVFWSTGDTQGPLAQMIDDPELDEAIDEAMEELSALAYRGACLTIDLLTPPAPADVRFVSDEDGGISVRCPYCDSDEIYVTEDVGDYRKWRYVEARGDATTVFLDPDQNLSEGGTERVECIACQAELAWPDGVEAVYG
jgi:hypothetical protein